MSLKELKKQNINNIVIFVSDSLRWDYTPPSILDMGISIKTIASSLWTGPSFASMMCGLYPIKTGVNTWDDLLSSNFKGFLNLDDYNTSLWCETTWPDLPPWKSDIHNILGNPKGISLENISSPFIYMEDDKGGHCPYGIAFSEYKKFDDFFREYGKKGKDELIKQYKKGIEQSAINFKNRLKILEERNLTENTLVIFTADHGELLGEYGGLVGHGRPSCPELVYVPTVFIHPTIKPQKLSNTIIRHVDLFPTITSILNRKVNYALDGIDLTCNCFPSNGLNFIMDGFFKSENKFIQMMTYKSVSMWDFNGGYLFHYLDRKKAVLFFLYKLIIRHPEFAFLIENIKRNSQDKFKDIKTVIKQLTNPSIKFGDPCFSKEEAKRVISEKFIESEIFKETIRIKMAINKLKIDKKI